MEDITVHDCPNILFKGTIPKQSYNVLFITDIDETFKPKARQFCIYFKSTVNSGHLN